MPRARIGQIELEYALHEHSPDAPWLVLIHGLGTQMTQWPDALLETLCAGGYNLLRFDNRDVGLSTSLDQHKPKRLGAMDLARWRMGARLDSPYTLSDMAADALGLMRELGIEQAHILGVSMGGMIAQQFALDHPEATRSLCVVMSTSGRRSVGAPRPEVFKAILTPPRARDRDTVIEHLAKQLLMLQGPKWPTPIEDIRVMMTAAFDRGMNPLGFLRQNLAVLNAPNREPALSKLNVPTLVLHGTADPLVNVSGGKAVAAAIPGARLDLIDGWGHDLPQALLPRLAESLLLHMDAG